MKAHYHLVAALVSSLAVLDIPPQYGLLGPGGAALQTLHWVAGDGHLLRDGLEYRQRVPVGQ